MRSAKAAIRILLICGIETLLLATGGPSQAMAQLTPRASSVDLSVATVSGAYGSTVALRASLTSRFRPLANKSISFALNGNNAGTATTDSRGVATLSVALVGINAGTYRSGLTATFAGDSAYRSKVSTALLIVNRASASVRPNPAGKTFGDADPVPLTTGTLSGFFPGDRISASYSRTPGERPGTYTITATLAPASALMNYNVTYNSAGFGINKHAFDICHSTPCSGATFTITPTAAYEGSVSATITLSPATLGGNDALNSPGLGRDNLPLPRLLRIWIALIDNPAHPVLLSESAATLTGPDLHGNYSWSANITAPLDASIAPGNYKVYVYGDDGAAITNNAVGNDAGYVLADTIDFIYRTLSASLIVTQAQPNVSVGAGNAIYTGTFYSDPATCSATGPRGEILPVSLTYVGTGSTGYGPTGTPPKNVGSYNAVCSAGGSDTNYAFTSRTAPFTILLRDASVQPKANGKNYGSADPVLTGVLNGFIASDNVTASFNRTPGEKMSGNPYTISATLSPASALTNYSITYGTSDFTIVPRTDRNVSPPADYTTFQPPPAGQSYEDLVFGTNIERLSDSMHTPDAAYGDGRMVTTIGTEYSTMTPFNEDNTRLLLVYLSYFALYDGSGNFLMNLPFQINTSSEPRWSRRDPNVLYYKYGNQLRQYNVATRTISIVHTFSEYSAISGQFESDICFDGDHFVFVGDGRYVFVYEINSDTKSNVFDAGGPFFDNVYITPDDNVLITWFAHGTGRSQGIEMFDRNMNFLRQVARAGGHMDVTRDTNGDEVLVWMNAGDPAPICNNGLVKIRLADATHTCLVTFDWSLSGHVSATDNSGWVFVETYAPSDPIPPSGWFRYTDEIIQIKLDGTQIRRLAHHRSRPFNNYSYQPRVSVSRDGRKLVYSSNYGLQTISGNPREYSDAYLIDVGVESPGTAGTAR